MKNLKFKKLIYSLVLLLIILLLIDFIIQHNKPEESVMANLTSDKTWSENSIFTNSMYQETQIQDIKDEYSAFDYSYTLKDPYIKLNPFNINPLSAYVIFDNDVPVKYSYEVIDEENNLNFFYEGDTYSKQSIIPVIGLFENRVNKVKIKTTDENGNTLQNTIDVITPFATYNEVDIKKNSELDDSIVNGWFFDPFYNAFDTNGNIRYNLNAGVEDNYMKFYDNHIFVKVDNYQTIYELNIMGKIIAEYDTPSSQYNFHHDLVKTDDGTVYALGSYNVELPNIPYSESLIFEYDKPGKPSRIIDIYNLFNDNLVSLFGTPNQNDPIHINSIEYLKKENELVISSQSQSFIAGINIDTENVDWVIQDDQSNIANKDKQLEIINPDNFEKTSGQHTVFLTNNSKYDSYREKGDYVFSILNNNNCKNDEGDLLFKTYEEEPQPELCTYDESDILIYTINLDNKTVEQIDKFTIPGEHAPIMSSVFDVGDNFIIHFNHGSKPKEYLIDNEGNVLVEFTVKNYSGNGYYRTNFLDSNTLLNLVKEAANEET